LRFESVASIGFLNSGASGAPAPAVFNGGAWLFAENNVDAHIYSFGPVVVHGVHIQQLLGPIRLFGSTRAHYMFDGCTIDQPEFAIDSGDNTKVMFRGCSVRPAGMNFVATDDVLSEHWSPSTITESISRSGSVLTFTNDQTGTIVVGDMLRVGNWAPEDLGAGTQGNLAIGEVTAVAGTSVTIAGLPDSLPASDSYASVTLLERAA
jgi:hypothetical protein